MCRIPSRSPRARAKCSSPRGFLLVEAVISAIVIGVGVAVVGRGLSNQLSALGSLEAYELAAESAASKLTELEGRTVFSQLISQDYQTFSSITDGPTDETDGLLTKRMAITAEAGKSSLKSVTLIALWPEDWLPEEWRE